MAYCCYFDVYLSWFLDCMAVGGKSTGWVECTAVILLLGVVLLSSYVKPLPVWDSMIIRELALG